jgi:hypothetical protein
LFDRRAQLRWVANRTSADKAVYRIGGHHSSRTRACASASAHSRVGRMPPFAAAYPEVRPRPVTATLNRHSRRAAIGDERFAREVRHCNTERDCVEVILRKSDGGCSRLMASLIPVLLTRMSSRRMRGVHRRPRPGMRLVQLFGSTPDQKKKSSQQVPPHRP